MTARVKAALRWLTVARFSWIEVMAIGTAVGMVSAYSLPWFPAIAICAAVGFVTGVVQRLLRRAAR